jgi:hypothetical protein
VRSVTRGAATPNKPDFLIGILPKQVGLSQGLLLLSFFLKYFTRTEIIGLSGGIGSQLPV